MLLLVILILTLISVLVLSWAQEWRTELKLASNFGEAHKCQRLAEAGIYYALGKLVTAKTAEIEWAESPLPPKPRGTPAPSGRETSGPMCWNCRMARWRSGSADEGGKINLNQAPEPLLHNFFTAVGPSGTPSPHHGGFHSGLAHEGELPSSLRGQKRLLPEPGSSLCRQERQVRDGGRTRLGARF